MLKYCARPLTYVPHCEHELYLVPNCLGPKPVSCGVRICPIYFPHCLFSPLSVRYFSQHPIINRAPRFSSVWENSETLLWLHFRMGNRRPFRTISSGQKQGTDRKQPASVIWFFFLLGDHTFSVKRIHKIGLSAVFQTLYVIKFHFFSTICLYICVASPSCFWTKISVRWGQWLSLVC